MTNKYGNKRHNTTRHLRVAKFLALDSPIAPIVHPFVDSVAGPFPCRVPFALFVAQSRHNRLSFVECFVAIRRDSHLVRAMQFVSLALALPSSVETNQFESCAAPK